MREHGTTHEPVEQLDSLRAIPALTLIDSAAANKIVIAWRVSRRLGLFGTTRVCREVGGEHQSKLRVVRIARWTLILVASGFEVCLIVAVAERLSGERFAGHCVSSRAGVCSMGRLVAQRARTHPIEAAHPQRWHRYCGNHGAEHESSVLVLPRPGATAMREYGFIVDNVYKRAKALW